MSVVPAVSVCICFIENFLKLRITGSCRSIDWSGLSHLSFEDCCYCIEACLLMGIAGELFVPASRHVPLGNGVLSLGMLRRALTHGSYLE